MANLIVRFRRENQQIDWQQVINNTSPTRRYSIAGFIITKDFIEALPQILFTILSIVLSIYISITSFHHDEKIVGWCTLLSIMLLSMSVCYEILQNCGVLRKYNFSAKILVINVTAIISVFGLSIYTIHRHYTSSRSDITHIYMGIIMALYFVVFCMQVFVTARSINTYYRRLKTPNDQIIAIQNNVGQIRDAPIVFVSNSSTVTPPDNADIALRNGIVKTHPSEESRERISDVQPSDSISNRTSNRTSNSINTSRNSDYQLHHQKTVLMEEGLFKFSLRGKKNIQLTTSTPRDSLHSGEFGSTSTGTRRTISSIQSDPRSSKFGSSNDMVVSNGAISEACSSKGTISEYRSSNGIAGFSNGTIRVPRPSNDIDGVSNDIAGISVNTDFADSSVMVSSPSNNSEGNLISSGISSAPLIDVQLPLIIVSETSEDTLESRHLRCFQESQDLFDGFNDSTDDSQKSLISDDEDK